MQGLLGRGTFKRGQPLSFLETMPSCWMRPPSFLPSFLPSLRFYLFIFRERGRDRERGREISMCGCLSCALHWGPDLQPRLVPCLGIELVTPWFTAHACSIHWAIPARAEWSFLNWLHFWWFPSHTASVPQCWTLSVVKGTVGLAKFLLRKKVLVEFTCDTSMQIQKHNSLF